MRGVPFFTILCNFIFLLNYSAYAKLSESELNGTLGCNYFYRVTSEDKT